jgi:hypothetical protein
MFACSQSRMGEHIEDHIDRENWPRRTAIRVRYLRHRHRGRLPFAGASGRVACKDKARRVQSVRRTGIPFPLNKGLFGKIKVIPKLNSDLDLVS